MKPADRLVVALDRSSRNEIVDLVDDLADTVGVFKIGLQAFVSGGPDLVCAIVDRGARVFLDLKLHDIPNTVARAVEEASRLRVSMLTVHAAGGSSMLRAAAEAARSSAHPPLVLAVTVLTSLDDSSLAEIGLEGPAASAVERLAGLAAAAGIGGVVASPREIATIRKRFGPALRIVTPGIRTSRDAAGDQTRTMSATEAIRSGADFIVVGRPILDSDHPQKAALQIVAEITDALS